MYWKNWRSTAEYLVFWNRYWNTTKYRVLRTDIGDNTGECRSLLFVYLLSDNVQTGVWQLTNKEHSTSKYFIRCKTNQTNNLIYSPVLFSTRKRNIPAY